VAAGGTLAVRASAEDNEARIRTCSLAKAKLSGSGLPAAQPPRADHGERSAYPSIAAYTSSTSFSRSGNWKFSAR
jgi:hypothetical protein